MEKKLAAHTADINCVKFHPFLRLAASCCDAGELKLWTF
jgi:WD40 repeat protein